MSIAATQDEPTVVQSVSRRWWILAMVVIGSSLYNAAVFVAAGLLPQMQGAMSATQDEISWTVTFNLLATAIVTPMTGWMVARFGAKRVMLWSIALFTLATLLCGLATSLESLVLWRIAQGGGGAALVPLAQTVLLDVFPRRQHSMVISAMGMANMVGPVIGPTVGGYLAEEYSWRWAFYMLIPFGVVAFVGLRLALPQDREESRISFDWTGFLTLSTAIGCAQLVLSRGQRLDWFDSTEIVIATAVAGLALYLFLVHSLTTKEPFVDLGILKDRNYGLGVLLVFIFGMLNFTPMVLLPPLLQAHAGYPDSLVGFVIAWRGVGATLGFFTSMWTSRLDPRIGMAAGFLLQVSSGIWLMSLDLNATLPALCMNATMQGFAVGIIWVPMTVAAFRTLAPQRRPEAMSMFHLARNIGSSLFISLSVAEIVRATGANYSRLAEHVSPYNRVLDMPGLVGAWTFDTLPGLAKVAAEINRQAALIGYLNAYMMYTVMSAVALLLVVFVGRRGARTVAS